MLTNDQLDRTQRATTRARGVQDNQPRGGSLAMGGRALRWGALPALLTMVKSAHLAANRSQPPPPGGEAGGACHLDEGFGYTDADLFGDLQNANSTATAEECCALCQHYAGIGCVFYQFAVASCSGHPWPSGCCRLKTAAAWNSRAPLSGAHSGTIKPLPPPPPPPPPDLNGSVVVFSAGLGGVPNYRIPAIVQTKGSPPALVAFAEARDGSDFTVSRIAVRTSTDAGDTWSAVTFAAGVCSPPVLVHRECDCVREFE